MAKAKKATTKTKATKTVAAKKTPAIKERYTKTQIVSSIAEQTELTKKEVGNVIDELVTLIERHVKKRACGEFVLPGVLKIAAAKKPATKARKGRNPFTGEEITIPAKKARTVVRVRPLKKLKEMVDA